MTFVVFFFPSQCLLILGTEQMVENSGTEQEEACSQEGEKSVETLAVSKGESGQNGRIVIPRQPGHRWEWG